MNLLTYIFCQRFWSSDLDNMHVYERTNVHDTHYRVRATSNIDVHVVRLLLYKCILTLAPF